MTKRERAIIMAYTGVATLKGDDIQYFLDYVKEKTGIEPEIRLSPESGEPCVYFGPEFEKTFEHCCDKKEEKKASNHEFSDAIAEAALEICGIDLKKGVKND